MFNNFDARDFLIFLYIDPGTGSMIFTMLLGLFSMAIYGIRSLAIKTKFIFSTKKSREDNEPAIDERLKYVIISDSKRYWQIYKPICDEFERRKIKLHYMTLDADEPVFSEKYEYIEPVFLGEGNKGILKMNLLEADIVVSTTPGLDVLQWKRSKGVKYYIHIPHAASDISIYHMFGIDYYDAVLLSGEFQIEQIRQLEELRNINSKELKIVGLPYLDVMQDKKKSIKIKNKYNKTVLLAPTWGPSSLLNIYGEKLIDSLIKTGYEIIIRLHPQSYISEEKLVEHLKYKYQNESHIEWNSDPDNFDVLSRADILVSDFSGILFDYALVFDRPVIYSDEAFDVSQYDAYWLGKELWSFEKLSKMGEKLSTDKLDNIKDLIDKCFEGDKYSEGRKQARKESWQYIGQGARNIADFMIEKGEHVV